MNIIFNSLYKIKTLILVVILFAFSSSTFATNPEDPIVLKLAQTINYIDNNQNKVWPGFYASRIPSLIDFDISTFNYNVYALNFTPKNPVWKKMSFAGRDTYYLENEAEIGVNPDSWGTFEFKIEDQSAFLNRVCDEKGLTNYIGEMFAYYYLYKQSKFPFKLPGSYEDLNNKRVIKLTYLELDALKFWLDHPGKTGEFALQDAVAIDQYRQSLLSLSSFKFDNALQTYLVSLYTGYKSLNYSDDETAKILIDKIDNDFCSPLGDDDEIDNIHTCYHYTFNEVVSPAFAFALDHKLNPNKWKKNLENEFKSPSTIIKNYYHMTLGEAKARTEDAMSNPNYNYAVTNRQIERLVSPYLDKIAIAENKYKTLLGIELQIDLSPMFFKFIVSDEGFKITDDVEIFINATTSFKSPKINYQCNSVPVTYIQFYHGLFSVNDVLQRLKISSNTIININGKTYTAEQLITTKQKFSFSQLSIKNSEIQLDINNQPGILDSTKQRIAITFDSRFIQDYHKMKIQHYLKSSKYHHFRMATSDDNDKFNNG